MVRFQRIDDNLPLFNDAINGEIEIIEIGNNEKESIDRLCIWLFGKKEDSDKAFRDTLERRKRERARISENLEKRLNG